MLLIPPFSAVFVGPSGCGKTSLIVELFRKKLIPSQKIVIFYQNWQKLYSELAGVESVSCYKYWIERKNASSDDHNDLERLIENITSKYPPGMVTFLFDDALPFCKTFTMEEIFTRMSHHYNFNVIITVQNLFEPSLRVITRNCHYIFIFRNPRDAAQIRHLAFQMYPDKKYAHGLINAIKKITQRPFSAALLDFKSDTNDSQRLKSDFLQENICVWCFQDDALPKEEEAI